MKLQQLMSYPSSSRVNKWLGLLLQPDLRRALSLTALLPVATLLASCGGEVNISSGNNIVAPNLTATPAELVVWPNDRPSIADGQPLFQQNCAVCHGANGTGGSANAKFDADWAHSTKLVDIYRVIAFGGTDPAKRTHPAFADKLNVTQLWDLSVYVRSFGQPPLDNKEISTINDVFGSNCAVCHGTKGDGDPGNLGISRNLEPQPANFKKFDRFFNRTDDVLYDHIANGIRWEPMPNFLGKVDRKKNVTFDEAYIRKLVQYVRTFQINKDPVLTANAAGATANSGPSPSNGAPTSPLPGASTEGGGAPGSGQTPSAGRTNSGQ